MIISGLHHPFQSVKKNYSDQLQTCWLQCVTTLHEGVSMMANGPSNQLLKD